jgi:hypothetical protein
MSKINKQMEENMQAILSSKGVFATVKIQPRGYKVSVAALPMSATMDLFYPDTLTPGEVTMAVANLFDKINGK